MRRRKIKNKDNKHTNQHEFLRVSTRKRQANKAIHDNDLMMLSDSQISDYDFEKPVEYTETNKLYNQLLQAPEFLLSMQPRMIEDVESEDEESQLEDN